MTAKIRNCWEQMKCGREPGGEKAEDLGVCPAAADSSFDGINRGKNAGRFCWAVAGTFCGGKVQGSFAEKRESCLGCDFFKSVRAEEGTANLQTKFLKFISTDTGRPLFKNMAYRHISAGQRFITQGDVEDSAYIIQRGSCIVIVEKDGALYPVGHRGAGDIVGMVTILTGEPRNAHVEAETDLELWVLKREQFENLSQEDPDLLCFFSEIVADRFDSKRPIADRTIGKYVATDIIGRGAFSLVYKGLHPGLSMPVAIKMMRHDLAMDSEFLRHFRNEAKTIASLNHRNIVNVYDIEERFKTVFIIMEYLEGESLKDMLARLKKIPASLAIDYLFQMCSGLQYAHQHGIIHRDMNTTNIIVQRDDRLKIIDFGLACPIGTEDYGSLGTVAYMAPEQIESEALDQRTDIYALSILAFEMVTGKRPFAEVDLQDLMKLHRTEDVPDPSETVADLPQALCRFITRAGRCHPDQRYQNVSRALDDLKELVKISRTAPINNGIAKRKSVTMLMSYDAQKQTEFDRLMEDFSAKASELGVEFKIADAPGK